ncbi:HAMP domain-containing sensor histidine kinase [Actinocorallia lasiicapitis]
MAAVTAVIVAGLTVATYVAIRHELSWQVNLTLQRTVADLESEDPPMGWASTPSCSLRGPAICVQTIPEGTPPGGLGPAGLPIPSESAKVANGSNDHVFSDIRIHGAAGRMLTRYVPGGAVQIAVQSQTYENSVGRLRTVLLLLGGAGIVLAAGGGWLVARSGMRPVTRLTDTAELIAATGDPSRRAELPVPADDQGRNEVARLAASFDTMLDVLERSLAAQRQLIADASHELRTPLTALKTNIDILAFGDRATPEQRARAVKALNTQVGSVTELVNDLIELARGKEPPALIEEVRLDEVVETAVETARTTWPELTFTAEIAAPVLVDGVPARLLRLISTLLDNAAKFSPADGTVEITLTADPRPDLTIRDHGPGIAPEDLPHIFDHFYRAPSARSLPGSGLGLAMARQIATAHHATLTAHTLPTPGALLHLRFT